MTTTAHDPRLHALEAAVLFTARRRRLFGSAHRVLAAISGGPDSTALLAALAALREAGAIAGVFACHVDHRLRAGSAADGEFCSELCASLGVELDRRAVDVPGGGNLQAAARRARYAALRRAAERVGAQRIATGHTRSDQAETVVHRLLRGSGARGLSGIPARRGRIVRPLLDLSRADVLAYLQARGLGWREDPTNASPRFLRNRIRREVLPLLEQLAPGIERRLARAADLLGEDDRALEAAALAIPGLEGARAPLAAVEGRSAAVGRRVVRLLWRAATGSRRGLGADHVDAVLTLARRGAPRRIALPGGVEARVGYGLLELGAPLPPPRRDETVAVPGPGTYRLPGRGLSVEIAWASARPAPWPLELRSRRPGDRFRPSAAGTKKLKAWLIDRKVPRPVRDDLVVVAAPAGRVMAVPQLGAVSPEAAGLVVVVHPDVPADA